METSIRIALAVAENEVCSRLRALLQADPTVQVVGDACDGLEAVRVTREVSPDVLLISLRLPRMSGIDATRLITSLPDHPRVLGLTAGESDEQMYEALRAGASGFLADACSSGELLEGLRTVATGHALLAPEAMLGLIEEFGCFGEGGSALLDQLSTDERHVLTHLAQGLPNGEIAEQLSIPAAAVEGHVSRLLFKLDLRDRAHAAMLAYDGGSVRPSP